MVWRSQEVASFLLTLVEGLMRRVARANSNRSQGWLEEQLARRPRHRWRNRRLQSA